MNSTAAAVDRNQTDFLDWRRRQRIVTCRGALTSPGHNGDSIRLVRIHQIDQYADFFDLDDNVKSDTVLHGGRNSLNHAGSLHQANQWKERRPLQTKSPHDGQKREERMKTKTWRDNANGAGFSAIKKILRSSAFAVAVFATSAVLATEARAQSCVDPEALTFAMVPTEETVAELQLYKPITDRLAQETGKKVQMR